MDTRETVCDELPLLVAVFCVGAAAGTGQAGWTAGALTVVAGIALAVRAHRRRREAPPPAPLPPAPAPATIVDELLEAIVYNRPAQFRLRARRATLVELRETLRVLEGVVELVQVTGERYPGHLAYLSVRVAELAFVVGFRELQLAKPDVELAHLTGTPTPLDGDTYQLLYDRAQPCAPLVRTTEEDGR